MSEGLVLAVIALVGLAVGVWLGLPGRDRQSPEDIERAMDSGAGGPRKRHAKRAVNPLGWLQRKVEAKPSRGRRSARRSGFRLESPEDRE